MSNTLRRLDSVVAMHVPREGGLGGGGVVGGGGGGSQHACWILGKQAPQGILVHMVDCNVQNMGRHQQVGGVRGDTGEGGGGKGGCLNMPVGYNGRAPD